MNAWLESCKPEFLGSGKHRFHGDCSRAASSVLCSNIAIVSGPTPPGTGVIAEATWTLRQNARHRPVCRRRD